jgi:hypothetical protein
VVPLTPDRTAATESPVDRARHADGESLDAACEHVSVIRFDDEMEVVLLDAELEQPEAAARSYCQRAANCRENPIHS